MKRLLTVLAAAGLLTASAISAPIAISAAGLEYTQDFNTLARTTNNGNSTTVWTDDSTLPGWSLFRAGDNGVGTAFVGGAYTYRVVDGTVSINGGNFLSMGAAGSTDRALGNPSTTTQGEMSAIAFFQNTSGLMVELTRIRHNVEVVHTNQLANVLETIFVWTRTAPTLTALQTMTTAQTNTTVFPTSVATTPNSGYLTGWDRHSEAEVSYTNPTLFTPVSVTIPVDATPPGRLLIPPGHFFAIRYSNINDAGTDHQMGIDDVRLSFTALSVNLSAVASNVVRNENGTPADLLDDTVDFTLTVTGTGAVNPAGWTVTSPSTIATQTGLYEVPRVFTGIPISEFFGPQHTLDVFVEDTGNPGAIAVATVTAPWCALTPVITNVLRNDGGTPSLIDDTWGYTVTVNGQFTGASWTSDNSSLPSGFYGTPMTVSGLSVLSSSETIIFTDIADINCTATVTVNIHRIIGTVNFGTALPLFSDAAGVPSEWSVDEFAPTQRMTGDRTVAPVITYRSEILDLSAIGPVKFTASLLVNDLTFGCEPSDSFNARLIIDGNEGAPVSLISDYDTIAPPDGVLTGAEITPASAGPPPVTGPGVFTHRFLALIPDSANSVQLVISGSNNSANESFTMQEIRFELAVHSLEAAPVSGVQFDNKGTVDPADDEFTQTVNIIAVEPPPGSTGWTSDATPAAGLYADPNPVAFGPFLQSAGARTIILTDNNVPAVTASVNVPAPVPLLIASFVAGTGFVLPDGTATFDALINAPIGGPEFRVSSDYPVTASASSPALNATVSTVTITLDRIPDHGPVYIYFEDASYPDSLDIIALTLGDTVTETEFILGRKNLGDGLSNLVTLAGSPLPVEWQNYPAVPAVGLSDAGGGAMKVLTSEVVNLSGVSGDVRFTANLHIMDQSSGFETEDTFKAELIINGDTANPVNLITPYDTILPINGLMNGGDPEAADEFNQAKLQDGNYVSDFPLDYLIPNSATSVQLVISGVNDSPTEIIILENVLIALNVSAGDADGDGMSDAYEDSNGLNRNDPADRNTDLDGDGESNYQEFLAGTAANEVSSRLRITNASLTGSEASLTWSSVPGKIYRIDISPDMSSWVDVGTDFAAADPAAETTASVNIPGAGLPPRYYLQVRVK